MIKELCISSCQQAQSGSKQAADEVDDRWDSASTFNDYMIRVLKVIMGAEDSVNSHPKILLMTAQKIKQKHHSIHHKVHILMRVQKYSCHNSQRNKTRPTCKKE